MSAKLEFFAAVVRIILTPPPNGKNSKSYHLQKKDNMQQKLAGWMTPHPWKEKNLGL